MRVLVVDDHPLIREALSTVLRQLSPGVEVDEATSAEQALDLLALGHPLTLALLDLTLPGADGMSLLAEVRRDRPELPVVVLSGSDSRANVMAAIEAGAMGFISKRTSTAVFVSALQLVLAGGIYIPPQALAIEEPTRRAEQPTVLPADIGLTPRQAQILALLVQGKPNKLICRTLGISDGTVKAHISSVLRVLDVDNRTEAVVKLGRLGVRLPGLASSLPDAVGSATDPRSRA
jgi:DNA-binding NarL/FixJ family response regulator